MRTFSESVLIPPIVIAFNKDFKDQYKYITIEIWSKNVKPLKFATPKQP